MTISPRELVSLAVDRKSPPRIPIYQFNRDTERSDVAAVNCATAADFDSQSPYTSEWGYDWESVDGTMGQPTRLPLEDWNRIDLYRPPDPFAAGRFDMLSQQIAENSGKFIKFGIGISGFNQATFLRGFSSFLEDLFLEPQRASRVLDMVFNFENGIIDQAVRFDIDAVSFADDWGTQSGLVISPGLWRELFKPRYTEQFGRIHEAGKKVWFHSCGDVSEIIGDLIDAGVDVLELLQPDLFGVDWLGEEFAGKVCFCCSIDHQRKAISGTRDEIFDYARLLRDRLGAGGGGFIAYIEDYKSLGMSEQNYQWICEAFHGLNGELHPCGTDRVRKVRGNLQR